MCHVTLRHRDRMCHEFVKYPVTSRHNFNSTEYSSFRDCEYITKHTVTMTTKQTLGLYSFNSVISFTLSVIVTHERLNLLNQELTFPHDRGSCYNAMVPSLESRL
jgi:hypothetical protein